MSKKDELDCLNAVKKCLLSKRIDKKLLKCFSTAKVNEKTTEFPDFICDGGFIEHFQVSAAKENRKGSFHNITANEFERYYNEALNNNCNEAVESKAKNLYDLSPTYELSVDKMSWKSAPGEYSYDYFIESIKKNLINHIESLHRCNVGIQTCIFMAQYVGSRIYIEDKGKFSAVYTIAKDRNLLNYLTLYKSDLDYFLIVYNDCIDIIDMSKIDILIEQSPLNICFGVGRYKEIMLNLNITL